MRTRLAALVATLTLVGCDCEYGGPGCGSPSVLGLCAPIIKVGMPVAIEIDYGDDTGAHPAEVTVVRIAEPTVIGVWPGPTTGSLTILGLAVGTSEVTLEVAGWTRPGRVEFAATAAPPPPCAVDPYADGPGVTLAIPPE